jgi:hypothetical protein
VKITSGRPSSAASLAIRKTNVSEISPVGRYKSACFARAMGRRMDSRLAFSPNMTKWKACLATKPLTTGLGSKSSTLGIAISRPTEIADCGTMLAL